MEVEQPGKVIRLHLDSYIQEVVTEYKAYIKKALRPKKVPMPPGLKLTNEDCPITPDPWKQMYYRLFISKLQFVASWIRFDTSFAVSTLARFCASAGPSHWVAFHHLMEYLKSFQSLKLTYRRGTVVDDGLSGSADSDWGNNSSRRSTSGNLCLHDRFTSFGTRRCRRSRRYPRQKRSTTRRRRLRRRFSTFVISSRT